MNKPLNRVRAQSADLSTVRVFPRRMLEFHHWCQPLNEPVWRPSSDAEHMNSDDPVLGFYLNNRAWALPWWIMKNHHVANLTLDDQPVVITLCEMCSSAAAFNPVLQGERFTFALAGQYNGTIIISDLQTDTLWSPFRGEGLTGPLKGTRLQRLALFQSLWAQWCENHPNSQVLYGEQALRQGHGSSDSPGSPGIPDSFCGTLLRPIDERLPHNTLVLGVEHAEGKAYPLSQLSQAGAVFNDTLGQSRIVIFHKPDTLQACAFSRQLGSDVLVFEEIGNGEIVDRNTGSYWNLTGEAVAGELVGHQLSFIGSGVQEWFVWAADQPNTEIFNFKATL